MGFDDIFLCQILRLRWETLGCAALTITCEQHMKSMAAACMLNIHSCAETRSKSAMRMDISARSYRRARCRCSKQARGRGRREKGCAADKISHQSEFRYLLQKIDQKLNSNLVFSYWQKTKTNQEIATRDDKLTHQQENCDNERGGGSWRASLPSAAPAPPALL